MVSLNAPHAPSYAAERHRNLHQDTVLPRPESFNEADVTDKPEFVQSKGLLDPVGISEVEAEYRQRLRA